MDATPRDGAGGTGPALPPGSAATWGMAAPWPETGTPGTPAPAAAPALEAVPGTPAPLPPGPILVGCLLVGVPAAAGFLLGCAGAAYDLARSADMLDGVGAVLGTMIAAGCALAGLVALHVWAGRRLAAWCGVGLAAIALALGVGDALDGFWTSLGWAVVLGAIPCALWLLPGPSRAHYAALAGRPNRRWVGVVSAIAVGLPAVLLACTIAHLAGYWFTD